MIILPAAVGTFLLVNLFCGCAALSIGFVAGVWFLGAKRTKLAAQAMPKKRRSAISTRAANRTGEVVARTASRLAETTQEVVTEVSAHSARMKSISAGLSAIDRASSDASRAVFHALDNILAANTELQQRLEKAEQRLAQQASEIRLHQSKARTDSLTGIANRRAFDDELKRRLSEWERMGTPCSLVLLDIDFFKRFNDTHGHQAGDEVLRHVARALQTALRDMDLACRYGGEEFAVILPATTVAKAAGVAERIRRAIERLVIGLDDKSVGVTCSIGLADVGPTDNAADLIRRADEALYASKTAGRNCGHWHTGLACLPITASTDTAASPQAASAAVRPTGARGTSRGTFIHILKRRVAESHRFGIPLSLLHVDLAAKETGNRYHEGTNFQRLTESATTAIAPTLGELDVLARFKAGELLIMLPGKTAGKAEAMAKRLRNAVEPAVIQQGTCEIPLRSRVSVAQLQASETAIELLGRALREAGSRHQVRVSI